MTPRKFRHSLLPFAGFSIISLASSHGATIIQTVNQGSGTNFSAAVWGTPAATPTAGNDYVSGTGFAASSINGFGGTYTGSVRNAGVNTFAGDSLTVVTNSRFQMNTGTATVSNLIVDGGTIASGQNTTVLNGGLSTNTSGTIGTGNVFVMTINSTVAGSGTFNLRSSDGTPTMTFGGAATAFNGFTGILNIGWNDNDGAVGRLLVDFNDAYTIPGSLIMDAIGSNTLDIINLDAAVTVNSFQFGGVLLANGTYNEAQLDTVFGTTDRFTGAGSLTVIPEPGAALLGGFGALALLRRRRAM